MAKACQAPQRMCVICRKRFSKQQLIRYLRKTDETAWQEDVRQTLQGRGLYVCRDLTCTEAFTRYGVNKRKRKHDAQAYL